MNARFFTEEAYDKLYDEIIQNENKYVEGRDWISDYFLGLDFYKKSTIEIEPFKYICDGISDEEINHEDYINAVNLHKALKNLTPLQASNKLMWTYLCHVTYEEYVHKRWLSKGAKENTIEQRYFVNNTRESLFLNALSRLWWATYITYDNERPSDPYYLTKILFSSQRIFQELEHTKNRMNKVRAKGVLLAIQKYENENPKVSISEAFRSCNKYLNRMAAITNFDTLSSKEIEGITFDYLKNFK